MLEDHENTADDKCDVRLCRCKVIQKFKCTNCGRAVHWACYNGIVLEVEDKPNIPALPEGSIACTKKCHTAKLKDSSNSDNQRADWRNDGKPETPQFTSIRMLLDWWLEHPNYEIYRGKNNEGVKKLHTCRSLAKAITEKTTSTGQTGEHIQLKIAYMEAVFRKTHEWSTGETGAGIMECDGKLTWNEALTNMFEYCHDLLPIMGDRASSQPKFTTSNPLDLDADPDEEAEAVAEDDANVSDNGLAAEQHVPASNKPDDKPAGKPPSKKGRNHGNRGPSPLMDPQTLEMFELASLPLEGKLMEMERHNAAVESNNAALRSLATRKARAKRMKNKYDYVKGRVALVTKYKELSHVQGLSDDQIVAFIPHLKDVVDMMNCELAFMNRKRSAEDDDDDEDEE